MPSSQGLMEGSWLVWWVARLPIAVSSIVVRAHLERVQLHFAVLQLAALALKVLRGGGELRSERLVGELQLQEDVALPECHRNSAPLAPNLQQPRFAPAPLVPQGPVGLNRSPQERRLCV